MLRELDARRGERIPCSARSACWTACSRGRVQAEQRFRQALDDASLHLRLSLNVAVALGR